MKITNEVGRGVRTLRDQVKVINEANRDIMDQLDARIKNLEKNIANEMEELETVNYFHSLSLFSVFHLFQKVVKYVVRMYN